jgi:hypothetical protein
MNVHGLTASLFECWIRRGYGNADLITPVVELFEQGRGLVRHLSREIGYLAGVILEVVKLAPAIFKVFEQFLVAKANGANGRSGGVIVRIMKVEGVAVELGSGVF